MIIWEWGRQARWAIRLDFTDRHHKTLTHRSGTTPVAVGAGVIALTGTSWDTPDLRPYRCPSHDRERLLAGLDPLASADRMRSALPNLVSSQGGTTESQTVSAAVLCWWSILNSDPGETPHRGLRCLAPPGRPPAVFRRHDRR